MVREHDQEEVEPRVSCVFWEVSQGPCSIPHSNCVVGNFTKVSPKGESVLSIDKTVEQFTCQSRGTKSPAQLCEVTHLDSCHSQLLASQDLPSLKLSNPGLFHLHEVSYQLCDVHLPVRAQQVGQVSPGIGCLSHKLGQDSHHGVLVLKGAASASLLIIIFLLTVPSWPVKKYLFVGATFGGSMSLPPKSSGLLKAQAHTEDSGC